MPLYLHPMSKENLIEQRSTMQLVQLVVGDDVCWPAWRKLDLAPSAARSGKSCSGAASLVMPSLKRPPLDSPPNSKVSPKAVTPFAAAANDRPPLLPQPLTQRIEAEAQKQQQPWQQAQQQPLAGHLPSPPATTQHLPRPPSPRRPVAGRGSVAVAPVGGESCTARVPLSSLAPLVVLRERASPSRSGAAMASAASREVGPLKSDGLLLMSEAANHRLPYPPSGGPMASSAAGLPAAAPQAEEARLAADNGALALLALSACDPPATFKTVAEDSGKDVTSTCSLDRRATCLRAPKPAAKRWRTGGSPSARASEPATRMGSRPIGVPPAGSALAPRMMAPPSLANASSVLLMRLGHSQRIAFAFAKAVGGRQTSAVATATVPSPPSMPPRERCPPQRSFLDATPSLGGARRDADGVPTPLGTVPMGVKVMGFAPVSSGASPSYNQLCPPNLDLEGFEVCARDATTTPIGLSSRARPQPPTLR